MAVVSATVAALALVALGQGDRLLPQLPVATQNEAL